MKRYIPLLPLIAALTGMSYAVAEDKPMPGPGMTAAAPQDMKDMKAKGEMMKPDGDMKAMHDKCMDGDKGMGDMKAMHDKCMKGMEGMKDMGGMKAKGEMMKPDGDKKAMHDKCMDGDKGMGDMKAMHDKCMKGMEGMKDMPGTKADATAKKTNHRKTVKKPAAPAAEHDHNHGATPTP